MLEATPAAVTDTLRSFLARVDKLPGEVTPELELYADGIGLDSLETAELSATLEDEFGTDPFSADQMPRTVAELLAFYDGAPKGS